MLVTQKMQYALRAIYELGKYYNQGPLKTAQRTSIQNLLENKPKPDDPREGEG